MKILITGTAGFIGFHLVRQLITEGHEIVGFDNINDYYSIDLKYGRLKESGIDVKELVDGKKTQSTKYSNYSFQKGTLEDQAAINALFSTEHFEIVINLAAQAGVRHSISNPHAYIQSNMVGFANILEACRNNDIKHFLYASSSSVYGLNSDMPFSTADRVDHPVSLYAATKKSNELMAHAYSHLYGLPTTGLRFFTAYGSWGRPDMAYYSFSEAIFGGKPIDVYNFGKMKRDFTHISDIVQGISAVIDTAPIADPNWTGEANTSSAPYRIFNLGNNHPVELMTFIQLLEKAIGKTAVINFMPIQDGDVLDTWANIDDAQNVFGYQPKVGIEAGLAEFVQWFLGYKGVER